MSLPIALRDKLTALLGTQVVLSQAAAGGDINQTHLVDLADGRRVFVKTHTAPLPGMYPCEARGLAWLTETRALRVPEVLASSDRDALGPSCLVLEYIAPGRRGAGFDDALGQGLATLHRAGAARFGLEYDNYLALLAQDNRASTSWPRFYAERRILPRLQQALREHAIDRAFAQRVEKLCARFDGLLVTHEPPARLHGDLWAGNLLCDQQGAPCLIDPAVYGGQREIDLAMMRLFGGFSERVFAAYAEAYPLEPGHRERVALYQLYPLLVHVNLFGGAYVHQVQELVTPWL
jgi:fructosamine-3-kinase